MTSQSKPSDANLINVHVFMVSFPGQGHVNPLLRLAKRLAASGLFVTFSAPEFAGGSIRKSSKISENIPTPYGRGLIQFEFFNDGWDFNDPNRDDLNAYMAQLETAARSKLPEMIKKQVEQGRPPVSCLINNPFIPWASDIAENLGIPNAVLWVQSCACFSAYYHYYHKLVPFPSEDEPEIEVKLPAMPVLKHDEIPSFLHPDSPYPFLARAILGQFRNLSKPFCLLMDTFEELESEIINSISRISGVPIRTIGPLFKSIEDKAESNCKDSIRADFYPTEDCIEFLDSQPPRSVVYISFGSIVHLKQKQVDEFADGILASGVAFLWVMRPPPREKLDEPNVLPEGFMEKVGGKGKVVQWGPQEKVLDHPSVACFVTHCGWNSTCEALASGVPVVAFPQWGDQVTNAKFLVDVLGVGIRMCRGAAEGRIIRGGEVEKCLREATAGSVAEEIRGNALKWKKAAAAAVEEGGSSERNLVEFLEEVIRLSCMGIKDGDK